MQAPCAFFRKVRNRLNEIIIDASVAEKRFAVKEDGLVTTLFIEQPTDRSDVGNIYLGRVESVRPGMNAAFINIGTKKNGFLQKDQIPAFIHSTSETKNIKPISHFLKEGEKILVQIKKDETGTKGPLLTAIIEFTSSNIVYMPEGKYISVSKKLEEEERNTWRNLIVKKRCGQEGFVIRTAVINSSEEEISQEIAALRSEYMQLKTLANTRKAPAILVEMSNFTEELRHELSRLQSGTVFSNTRNVIEPLRLTNSSNWSFQFHHQRENIFSKHQLETELEKAQRQMIYLDDGAYIVINETEAAVVIDVNTGKFTGKQLAADTIRKTNLAASHEIARQLRIRDYGGIILVDFINMKSIRDRNKVQEIFVTALKTDPKHIRVVGFTPLGIFELTRKRTKQSLSDTTQTECAVCRGSGKVDSPETIAFRLERELHGLPRGEFEAVLVECDNITRSTFAGENNRDLKRIEESLHMKILFKVINNGKYEYYLRQFDTVENIQAKLTGENR